MHRPRVPSGQCRVAKPCALRRASLCTFSLLPRSARIAWATCSRPCACRRASQTVRFFRAAALQALHATFVPPADAVEDPLLRVNTLPRDEVPSPNSSGTKP